VEHILRVALADIHVFSLSVEHILRVALADIHVMVLRITYDDFMAHQHQGNMQQESV
jgi:hypothetical protein